MTYKWSDKCNPCDREIGVLKAQVQVLAENASVFRCHTESNCAKESDCVKCTIKYSRQQVEKEVPQMTNADFARAKGWMEGDVLQWSGKAKFGLIAQATIRKIGRKHVWLEDVNIPVQYAEQWFRVSPGFLHAKIDILKAQVARLMEEQKAEIEERKRLLAIEEAAKAVVAANARLYEALKHPGYAAAEMQLDAALVRLGEVCK